MDRDGNEVVVVINFSGVEREEYRIGVDGDKYKIVLNSDSLKFGGEERFSKRVFSTSRKGAHGKSKSIQISLNRFSGVFLQRIRD